MPGRAICSPRNTNKYCDMTKYYSTFFFIIDFHIFVSLLSVHRFDFLNIYYDKMPGKEETVVDIQIVIK
jgi:hypothetical protein